MKKLLIPLITISFFVTTGAHELKQIVLLNPDKTRGLPLMKALDVRTPLNLVLITDISRFRAGSDSLKTGWANIDCGIVSQIISLFCTAIGLKTRPGASFPGADKIRELLKLKDTQYILLNHPVGYSR